MSETFRTRIFSDFQFYKSFSVLYFFPVYPSLHTQRNFVKEATDHRQFVMHRVGGGLGSVGAQLGGYLVSKSKNFQSKTANIPK